MSKIIGVGIVVILLVGVGFFATRQQSNTQTPTPSSPPSQPTIAQPKQVNYKAAFAIFTNGAFRIFTASMYHNLSTDVYIEAGNPNIVIVKKDGITWNDFFSTLPLKLTKDCLTTGTKQTFCTGTDGALQFYLNGVKTDTMLDLAIRNGDRALITFGNLTEKQLQEQFEKVPIVQ